jgi:hypothetical protein
MSGLGKGITASSIAVLLQGCGWKVRASNVPARQPAGPRGLELVGCVFPGPPAPSAYEHGTACSVPKYSATDERRVCQVSMIKIDPYLNVDAGTMSPFEHGETFVLDDGGETDLDLGNYERFLDISLSFPPPNPCLCALVPRPSIESFSDGLWPPTSLPQRALSALMGRSWSEHGSGRRGRSPRPRCTKLHRGPRLADHILNRTGRATC